MSMTDLNIILNRIKEKILLSQIVEMDVRLVKKGREFVGNCPFHQEKTGSFFVNDEKGTFYCFGCGASGDIIEYVKRKNNITFQQAVEKLADQAGIKLPEKNSSLPVKSSDIEINQRILQKSIEFFMNSLNTNNIAKEYCKLRGITDEIINKFSIGYAPNNNDALLKYLRTYNFLEKNLIASGLFIKKNFEMIPRFKARLMFPVFNRAGEGIAFGG
ncbi:MAG: hypothetical protein LBE97_00845, partial [Holosporales bacterium]|nr:hypothetical protein [Holosporales bacterium]